MTSHNGSPRLGAAAVRCFLAAVCLLALNAGAQSNTILNGSDQQVPQNFLFEPEVPMASLKTVPTWFELEQLLDNPYRVALCSSAALASAAPLVRNTPGTEQGFPSYCTNPAVFTRRPGFGVTLPPLLVDALNYNPTTGEEMRLLNRYFPQSTFNATSACYSSSTLPCTPTPVTLTVSSGLSRIGLEGAEIDYNSPLKRDVPTCVPSTEILPAEGTLMCGGDPGEPGYFGFGFPNPSGYSMPAVPWVMSPQAPIASFRRLFDPVRGDIVPLQANGWGGLRKPSLRTVASGGNATNPNYARNTDIDDVMPSNENDYIRNRERAMQLGKALFWDMQVGSDGVQSCGTCHFHAGGDNRTRNQLNPNHLGPQGFGATLNVRPANGELVATDFPLHKLLNPDIAGDPLCTTPIKASINPGVLENNFPNGATNVTVCDAANVVSDSDDVVSSMGVHFGTFFDIPTPGTTAFATPSATGAVRALLPDLRSPIATQNIDPIADFAGTTGNQFRRVEPRNTPTFFGVAFNFDNFWDARARHDFNGGSPFGASDPNKHVYVGPTNGPLTATRQIIRFSSTASTATGPALSEFEMSFQGRNWQKIGKKLLQGTAVPGPNSVTPLANQLVAPTDSVLGLWSNQGGTECLARARATATGKPGLCTTYRELIQEAFFPALWRNVSQHLNGTVAPCVSAINGVLTPANCDPFDGYTLTTANGPAQPSNTHQFTQQESNFSLFWGLSIHLWATILVPDDTPFDQFLDQNPDAFGALGEAGEAGLVPDQPMCTTGTERWCFREVGIFKRDVARGGTRTPGPAVSDPLLGLDLFEGSNLSLKNPNFRSARCGECHALPTFTDNTVAFTIKAQLRDFLAEFLVPGVENTIEPLGRLRLISGFLLESEVGENGQDAVERRIANQSIAVNPADGLAYPDGLLNPLGADGVAGTDDDYLGAGQSFFDNGVYNLGVRPIDEDIGRGGNDAFGWPLSLSALLMKNLGGVDFEPGVELATFVCENDPCDPTLDQGGGLFEETAQDKGINPGFSDEPIQTFLPGHLAPFINQITVGDAQPDIDEMSVGLNTLTDVPILEGFIDNNGPFNPAGIMPEALNIADGPAMGTWPVVNRVGRMGSFKAAPLREAELTGPYFHNGGKLTLRQVVDFYARGGDFPVTNAAHRDFNIINQNMEVQSNLSEEEKVALVDFLLTLTDDRVRFERAPFDHPEVIVPLDGLAPDNTTGRDAMLTGCVDLPPPEGRVCAGGMFRDVPAVGAAGSAAVPNYLGILGAVAGTGAPVKRLVGAAAFCGTNVDSQYCH